MTTSGDEVFIDFTGEEVLTLVDLLDLEPPPALGAESLEQMSLTGDPERLRSAAMSSLRARGILGVEPTNEIAGAVVDVINTIAHPGVSIVTAVENHGRIETRYFAAMPEISIEQQSLSLSLHRYIPFATRDLLARVIRFAEVRPFEPAAPHEFRIEESTLAKVDQLIGAGDHASAIGEMQAAAIDEKVAGAFVNAVTMKLRTVSVTVLHRPDEDTFAGGALSWMDSGLSGLWITEPSEQKTDELAINVVDSRSLAAELLSYLPEAFGEYGLVL